MSVELLLTTTKPNYSYKNKNHNNNIDINNYFNKTISLLECDLIKISLVCRSLFSKLKRTQPITYLWTFLKIISKKFIKQLMVSDGDALTRKVVT